MRTSIQQSVTSCSKCFESLAFCNMTLAKSFWAPAEKIKGIPSLRNSSFSFYILWWEKLANFCPLPNICPLCIPIYIFQKLISGVASLARHSTSKEKLSSHKNLLELSVLNELVSFFTASFWQVLKKIWATATLWEVRHVYDESDLEDTSVFITLSPWNSARDAIA